MFGSGIPKAQMQPTDIAKMKEEALKKAKERALEREKFRIKFRSDYPEAGAALDATIQEKFDEVAASEAIKKVLGGSRPKG